jgi:hypothetical protein
MVSLSSKAKQSRTRVTKKQLTKVKKAQQKKKNTSLYKCKKRVVPGPWTEFETELVIEPKLRWSEGVCKDDPKSSIFGKLRGTYPHINWWDERGWYPIYINLVCPSIAELVEKYGMMEVVAAFEKGLNTESNQKEFGTIVLLKVVVNHSLDRTRKPSDRFLSCFAKTTKRDIVGFLTTRGGNYRIIEKVRGQKNNESK